MDMSAANALRARPLGIDTYQEPVIFLHAGCRVCRSEGFEAQSRVAVHFGQRHIVATLNVVHGRILKTDEAGFSDAAWRALGVAKGDVVTLRHPDPVESFAAVRAKIYGHDFQGQDLAAIVNDIAAGHYSGIEVAAFVTACAGSRMSVDECIALTRAMVDGGARLTWRHDRIIDKHCVGGLPGNRTTPIVVAIVAAAGLFIPKTSSRAITSPAGTADVMEQLAPVDLTLEHMRRVVERHHGCVVWGGAMALAPADDLLIRVERPLDFDSPAQLAASIVAKKVAAGATHVVIDVPVGATAKVRGAQQADAVETLLTGTARAFGVDIRILRTDGSQPVGNGIGPALEAHDVMRVLRCSRDAPEDLRRRAIALAAELLELGGRATHGKGVGMADELLASGAALKRFEAICEAQGGMRVPAVSRHRRDVKSGEAGTVRAIDNRRLSRIAKLAGAPLAAAAGLQRHVHLGERVERGQPLFTVHAETPGELEYAGAYAVEHPPFDIGPA